MKRIPLRTLVAAAATLLATGSALADITIGVSLSLTGPGSGLGIPMQNQFKLFPQTIAGEKEVKRTSKRPSASLLSSTLA